MITKASIFKSPLGMSFTTPLPYMYIENTVGSITILTLSNLNVDARDDSARSMNSCFTSKNASLFTDRNGVHLLGRAKMKNSMELQKLSRENRINVHEEVACPQRRGWLLQQRHQSRALAQNPPQTAWQEVRTVHQARTLRRRETSMDLTWKLPLITFQRRE